MTSVLTAVDIVQGVERIQGSVSAIRDELNAADRLLGDGDTGMTIAQVIAAWQTAVATSHADVGGALAALGRETRRASGSTLGAVLAMGLTAAGKQAIGKAELDAAGVAALLAAATTVIRERSGATPGDKSILDSLLRIEHDLAQAGSGAAMSAVALASAEAALNEFRERESRLGRARVYGSRSIGHDDPGMLAVVLMLRAAVEGA